MTTLFKLFFKYFPIVFIIVFALVLAVFIWIFISIFSEKRRSSNAPLLSVPARVVSKRSNTHGSSSVRTAYYATFEVESGDRMELSLTGDDFGLLCDGDSGILSFRGTQFVSFKRG